MSPRRIIFIVIALVAAGATMFLGRAWLAAQHARPEVHAAVPQKQPQKMVLVASGNLHTGQFLRPENLRWEAWPADGVASAYILSDNHRLQDYVGAVARNAIGDGEPITDARVVRPGDRGFLAAVLRPGYRAVTVALTPSQELAGLVFPGDHVDLIATMTLTDAAAQDAGGGGPNGPAHDHHVSETVLTNLRVLALDQRADDDKKEASVAKTATLEVTPKQAEVIAVVGDIGKLSLSLRSLQNETDAANDEGPHLSYTFDSDATGLIRPPQLNGSMQKIAVVRGSKVDQVELARHAHIQHNTASHLATAN
jgi:pilus assembly protein CpaB